MITITVDTDGTSGDYSTLSAALASLSVPLTEDVTINCSASTDAKDTTAVTCDQDTTEDYRLYIIGDGDYILSLSDADSCIVDYDDSGECHNNVTFDNVRFEKASMSANYQSVLQINSPRDGQIIVKNCTFIGVDSNTYRDRMIIINANSSYNATAVFVNNLIIGLNTNTNGASACIYHQSTRPVYMYNNTIVGRQCNFGSQANALYINNIINTSVSNYTVSTSSDYNMFSGAFDFGGDNDEQEVTFDFENTATFDYHLTADDTGAKDKGTDLSSDDNYAFSTDKDGDTRSGTWDVGAYEYTSGGSTASIPAIMHHFAMMRRQEDV